MPAKTSEREYRDLKLSVIELDEDGKEKEYRVGGYASTFNEPYTLYEDDAFVIREQVDPDAFAEADMSDIILQYDHEGRVFARISNGTLDVGTDEHGLKIEADLGGTEIGRQLYEEIKGGYTTKMSYGYTVAEDAWESRDLDNGKHLELRTVKRVGKVYDVSAVSLPANNATDISVRNLSDGAIEQIKAERLKALELERRKLKLKITLGGN